MRLAYILLGMFLLFAGLRVKARELSPTESLALVPLKKTMSVKEYMEEELGNTRLSFTQTLSFRTLKLSCLLLDSTLERIAAQTSEYPDQSQLILQQYALCSEGVLGLSQLYVKTREQLKF